MTILVSSSVKQTYVNRLVAKMATVGAAVTLYTGTKPTVANYNANFSTLYHSGAAAFLWHGTGLTQWSQTGNTMYMSTPPTATVPTRNGVASWAVLWPTAVTLAAMASPNNPSTLGYIIVDVTSVVDGTGVVQLTNTTLASTDAALTLDSAGFTIA